MANLHIYPGLWIRIHKAVDSECGKYQLQPGVYQILAVAKSGRLYGHGFTFVGYRGAYQAGLELSPA